MGFKLVIFASFQNEEEFIGADWIRKLYQISKTQNLGLFDISVRYSNNASDSEIPTISGLKYHLLKLGRFDTEFLSKHLIPRDEIQKVYICGPPAMNKTVP